MATHTPTSLPPLAYAADSPLALLWQNAPLQGDEYRQRIAALGQRIAGYVEAMCQSAAPENASAEARDKAVALFYERLLAAERQLARIHEALRLV